MQTISHSQLVEILRAAHGARPVGLITLTDARALKTGNPFGTVLKWTRGAFFVGANYQSAVRREGERQGEHGAATFEAMALPKHREWLVPCKVLRHTVTGRLYLRTQSAPRQRACVGVRVLGYQTQEGTAIERALVAPFLPSPTVSNRQAHVGLDDAPHGQVWVRDYAFDSIKTIRIGGRTYRLA